MNPQVIAQFSVVPGRQNNNALSLRPYTVQVSRMQDEIMELADLICSQKLVRSYTKIAEPYV